MERRQGTDFGRISGRPGNRRREAWSGAARPGEPGGQETRSPGAAGRASDLEYARIIAVPGEHGGGPAVRPPRFGKLPQLLLARLLVEPHQAAELDHHRKVAGGEDVGTPLGEEEIDFGRPSADAFDLGEQGNRFLIVFRQFLEVEL